jgi:hypothetical protein
MENGGTSIRSEPGITAFLRRELNRQDPTTLAKAGPTPYIEKKAPAPEMTPASEPEAALPIETEESAPFTPEVQRVNLVHGRFRFLDEKLKSVATFDDVRFRSGFRTATDLSGDISIERTSLRDRFFLEQLQSPLRYAPDELDFSQITAHAGGGEVTGRFTLLPQNDDPFFLQH